MQSDVNFERVNVLNIPLYGLQIQNAVEHVSQKIKMGKTNLCISATGAHGLIYAKRNPEFKAVFKSLIRY